MSKKQPLTEANLFNYFFNPNDIEDENILKLRTEFGFPEYNERSKNIHNAFVRRRKYLKDKTEFDYPAIRRNLHLSCVEDIINKKAELLIAYYNKTLVPFVKDWYILIPKESYIGYDDEKDFHRNIELKAQAYYVPIASSIDEAYSIIIQNCYVNYYINWVDVLNISTGEKKEFFIGKRDAPEPQTCCEHKWEHEEFLEDMVTYEEEECMQCKLKRIRITGDFTNYLWNKNHGWRYHYKDFSPVLYDENGEPIKQID